MSTIPLQREIFVTTKSDNLVKNQHAQKLTQGQGKIMIGLWSNKNQISAWCIRSCEI